MGSRGTRVFLVRHGEIDARWRDRIYGALDIPLSERGCREALRAVELLRDERLQAVISSGLRRAEYGAGLLRAPRGLERKDDPALREIDRGAWAGLTLGELERREPGAWSAWLAAPADRRPPAGESLDDLGARVVPAVDRWARAHPGDSIAVVTHGWVIRILVCLALGLALDRATRLDVRTGDIVLLSWPIESAPSRPRLLAFALDRTIPGPSDL